MSGKKVIQFVKTFDGALWAVQQVKKLKELGWDVHVVSPSLEGRYRSSWIETGATLHAIPCEFPVKSPWKLPEIKSEILSLVRELKPDLIHSHFVSTTLMLRYALRETTVPRIFQVPGPLHLEHNLFGQWETFWSDSNDHWIASSRYIQSLYQQRYGINKERVHLSYYGTNLNQFCTNKEINLRTKFSIPQSAKIFGNVSFIYPPKHYLGQRTGLKGHELMISALLEIMQERDDVWGVFIGQQWGKSQRYFEKLKAISRKESNRIIFTGYLPQQDILSVWREFDFALHLPSSENCGGVIEPMLNGIPTIASNVGGLPEVVIPGKTGLLTQRNQKEIVQEMRRALSNIEDMRRIAEAGKNHVSHLFDVNRTATEVSSIYERILKDR